MHADEAHSENRPLLSVIVPVHNEVATIGELLRRLAAVPIEMEILVVDDGSTDGSVDAAVSALSGVAIQTLRHAHNRGKGAAVRTGLAAAAGSILVIQDADLEYNPAQIPLLVEPILAGRADVVYGTRLGVGSQSAISQHRRWVNALLTRASNLATGLALTDMETGSKALRREAAANLVLREDRFGVEPELTAKIARGGWRVVEVPIHYTGRSVAAGKTIGWRDGLRALWCIVRYWRWD